MNKFSLLCTVLLITGSLVAQNRINYTNTAPEIDGFPEDVWWNVEAYPIDKPFKTETPTITATWQAIYDDENFYVLVTVEDDDHWPGWEANGDSTQYDMPEIFWDVNQVLEDGKGAKDVGSGHYRFAEGFAEGRYDEPITKAPNGSNPGGTYCYSLFGEGYIYEISVPLINLKDELGNSLTTNTRRNFGFDVAVIDQDEGITTARQRGVWSNDGNGNNGSIDESWNNLDGAEDIMLDYPGDFDGFVWFVPSSIEVTLSADSEVTASVQVLTNLPWNAVSNRSWLDVTQSTQEGNGTLTLTALENNGETRKATITIIWGGWREQVIAVTQLGSGVGNYEGIESRSKFIAYCVCDNLCFNGRVDNIQLFNCQGVLVKSTLVTGKTVSVSELHSGIYIVKAYNNGKLEGIGKIIKKDH